MMVTVDMVNMQHLDVLLAKFTHTFSDTVRVSFAIVITLALVGFAVPTASIASVAYFARAKRLFDATPSTQWAFH